MSITKSEYGVKCNIFVYFFSSLTELENVENANLDAKAEVLFRVELNFQIS